jgi:secondary thiamine-phosphate synthase enzyme
MKIHSDYLTIQTKQKREFINITQNIQFAMEKSGIRDGVILVSALHTNSALFVNDEEPGLLQDVDAWLQQLAPHQEDYKHGSKFESNASAHLQSLLAHHQVLVPISDGKLELGPWQQVIYAELDGQRPKRILIKVLGE